MTAIVRPDPCGTTAETSASSPETLRRPLFGLSFAMLLPSLGTSIANVALPDLSASFGASATQVQWIVLAYLLTVTALVVVAGRLGDLHGRRPLLLFGIVTFTVGSAFGAFAGSLWALVLARGIQGAGAAFMMALVVALASDAVPAARRGSAIGLLVTVSASGTALGPSLGGLLVEAGGWRAVFAFLALAGALAVLVAGRTVPARVDTRADRTPLDIAGALLFAASLGSAALAVMPTLDPVARASLAGIATGGAFAFVLVERRARNPLIDLQVLADAGIAGPLASLSLVSAVMMSTLIVGPFYLADAMFLSPLTAGFVMSVGPATAAAIGIPAGRLVDRMTPSAVALVGLAMTTLGAGSMTILPLLLGIPGYTAALATTTAGYALFQAANNTAVMSAGAAHHRGVLSALLTLARNVGLIIGASVLGLVFAWGMAGADRSGMPGRVTEAMQLTFAVGSAMAAAALVITAWGSFRKRTAV